VAVGQVGEGVEHGDDVLALLLGADPQDVGLGDPPSLPAPPGVRDTEPGHVDTVRYDPDPIPLDAVELLDVEGGGAGRADDAGRLGGGDVGAALVEGPGPAGVAVGEADRGEVVDRHDEGGAPGRRNGRAGGVDDVEVAGHAPAQIAEKLRREFIQIVAHPVVTVTVDEPHPFTIPVTGEVTRPGVYPLDSPAGVLQAIASAGGLTQFAHEDRIYVLRPASEGAQPVRIRFRYEALAHAEGRSGTFHLQRSDIVVVE